MTLFLLSDCSIIRDSLIQKGWLTEANGDCSPTYHSQTWTFQQAASIHGEAELGTVEYAWLLKRGRKTPLTVIFL